MALGFRVQCFGITVEGVGLGFSVVIKCLGVAFGA